MIFQAGARDLLAVVEIFRTDEADHAVDQERVERTRHRVGARLQRLLVDTVMRVGGERAALPGLEIHHVVADGAAAKRERGLARLAQQRKLDAEALVGRFGAGDRLEHEIDRRAVADQIERGGDMREHAGLRWNVELDPDLLQHREQRMRIVGAVGCRIDADHRVAGAKEEAVQDARGDAARIVGRMIRL